MGPNRLYSYDECGNITSDGTRTFEYNQNNRLVRVSREGAVLGEYCYDGQGRRVKKLASGIVTLYHYDYAGNLIAETDGNGTPLRDYVYLNDERIAMRIYGTQAGWYYFINDHLGTPHKIVSASGEVVWAAAYLPFGGAQVVTETVANNFRFPGQYYDAESGLHYNWHRCYDPKTGRYLTPDPIGQAGGINLYPYCFGNPVSLTDPDGRIVWMPILLGSWAAVEFALSVYDGITTIQTIADPCASGTEKASSVGLFILGMAAPGGGYGALDDIGKYLAKKAPKQVQPGIKILKGQYVDDLGNVQPWTTHYDEYGRIIARTDYNAGNKAAGIPDIHHHLYEWGPGKTPLEIESHVAGEFIP